MHENTFFVYFLYVYAPRLKEVPFGFCKDFSLDHVRGFRLSRKRIYVSTKINLFHSLLLGESDLYHAPVL